MIKFLIVFFVAGTPAGAKEAPTLEQCVKTAAELNADPEKPPEIKVACFALRESA